MSYDRKSLKWNGWGAEGQSFELGERQGAFFDWVAEELGAEPFVGKEPVDIDSLNLPPSGLENTQYSALADIVGAEHVHTDLFERAFHAVGKSYRDLIRVRRGLLKTAPDVVVYPGSADEVAALIAFCNEQGIAVVPYGGGSSVVGGVEASKDADQNAVLTLDMTRMNQVLEIDRVSRTARIQAGIYGPDLESALQEQGLTLGHYPQSFEYSTLGGWIAARGAGQQSNGYGVAASWLCGARVVTPSGEVVGRTFPNSAAGPDMNQIIAGSEGALGVITEATVRVHDVPNSRDYRAYFFKDFVTGSEAVRDIMQRGIQVSMLRLSDADETYFFSHFSSVGKKQSTFRGLIDRSLAATGYGENACMLLVGVEGEKADVAWTVAQTTAICVKHGALPLGTALGKRWYQKRFDMPYLRDSLLDHGVGVDTLETASEWSNVQHLYQVVGDAIGDAIEGNSSANALVMCHISHAYHTGCSLYFTFVFAMDQEDPVAQWQKIKTAACDAIVNNGGTISHHHGVGADHQPWMEQEKGEGAMSMLRAMRTQLDPNGIMNPGKVV